MLKTETFGKENINTERNAMFMDWKTHYCVDILQFDV